MKCSRITTQIRAASTQAPEGDIASLSRCDRHCRGRTCFPLPRHTGAVTGRSSVRFVFPKLLRSIAGILVSANSNRCVIWNFEGENILISFDYVPASVHMAPIPLAQIVVQFDDHSSAGVVSVPKGTWRSRLR